MTNENSALDVLHDSSATRVLEEQVAALQERLAQYETTDNVARPRFNGEVPRYRLNAPCYLEDDTLHVEGEEIEYINDPNDQMVPLNDSARVRMQSYLEQLREGQRLVAMKNGRQFDGLILDKGDLVALMGKDARNEAIKVQPVSMPEDKGTIYPMPHLPDAQAQARRRGKNKASPVVSAKAPAPPKVTSKPADVLGSRYTRDSASNTNG